MIAPQQDANQHWQASSPFPSESLAPDSPIWVAGRCPRCPRKVSALARLDFLGNDANALKVPAARCACILALLSRFGACFNPKPRNQIRLFLTASISIFDMGSDVFSVTLSYLAGNASLG